MKNLFKSCYKILSIDTIEKNNKTYYIVKLYLDFSDCVISCFVDKITFDLIKNKTINDTNLIEHLYFKIDKDMKCHIFIK